MFSQSLVTADDLIALRSHLLRWLRWNKSAPFFKFYSHRFPECAMRTCVKVLGLSETCGIGHWMDDESHLLFVRELSEKRVETDGWERVFNSTIVWIVVIDWMDADDGKMNRPQSFVLLIMINLHFMINYCHVDFNDAPRITLASRKISTERI